MTGGAPQEYEDSPGNTPPPQEPLIPAPPTPVAASSFLAGDVPMSVNIAELKRKSVLELQDIAEGYAVENIGALRKQELIFQIEQKLLDQNVLLTGEGVLEILPEETAYIGIGDLRQIHRAPLGFVHAVQNAEEQGGLILEVVVNRPIGDSCGLCYIVNGGAVKAPLSKHLRRCIQDLSLSQGSNLFLKGFVWLRHRGISFRLV